MNATTELLLRGAEELGLSLNDRQYQQLFGFVELIQKWNRAYNLVGAPDPQTLVTKHLLDCLSVAQFIGENNRLTGKVTEIRAGFGRWQWRRVTRNSFSYCTS